uniref:Picornavirus capsid domain-containing protein n=1 Tax=Picornavirales sp. TaxID=1955153 RepID=A0A514CZA9_9VIRU|nr:MAG: hypothetical protein H4Bulk479_000002 [Picornavirales sp.]
MPLSAFGSTQGQLWKNKLSGFFGIRMDMRFRIVVNANRFQQGRYVIGWVPLAGMATTTSNFKAAFINNMHMATLVQRTTVPHVEFDLATETSAELLIPFVSTQNFWPLNSAISGNDVSTLGYLSIYPYSPLVSPAGSTVASYTLYVSFENVKLFGAASPQAGIRDKEISNKMNGPISGIASAVSRGFREFSTIPALSEVAGTISWISDRIARTANMFGFSKPTQGDSLSKFMLLNNSCHSQVDGDCEARSLGFISKPGVMLNHGLSGSSIDEMDFSYIVRKYAYYRQFNWTLLSTGVLVTQKVVPVVSVSASVGLSYPPVSYLTNFFSYWRGSLKYRFKIVKTEFHSGRIQVCFYPTDESTFTASAYYVNRQIIDIRDTNEFEVTVPYISRSPYANVSGNESIGTLTIEVVDALVAPATVNNYVTFLVEICGGDDFEVAQPKDNRVSFTYAVPQSGLDKTSKSISFCIGNSVVNANPITASALVVGDKISSLRSFLKRFTPMIPNSGLTASTSRPTTSLITVTPDMLTVMGTGTATYYYYPDNVALWAPCYALWNGGIRIKDDITVAASTTPANIPFSNTATVVMYPANNYYDTDSQPISTNNGPIPAYTNLNTVIQNININPSLVVEVPQYTQNLSRCVADVISLTQDSPASYQQYQYSGSNTNAKLYIAAPIGLGPTPVSILTYNLHNIYRALADDAQFSTFISIPPVVAVPNATNGLFL